jgi:hypothetical protein
MNLHSGTQTSAIVGHCLCSTREPTDCQRTKVSELMVAMLAAERKKTEMGVG